MHLLICAEVIVVKNVEDVQVLVGKENYLSADEVEIHEDNV